MAIYVHGEVQLQRKSRHFLMRELMTRKIIRCRDAGLEMRNAILGNDLKDKYKVYKDTRTKTSSSFKVV